MITLLEDARAMLAEKEGGGPIRARVLARLAAALRDQPDRGARDQQHRGRPPWTLKTEISRTAIPIAASMALELSGHVARWPGETVLTNPVGGLLERWRLERAIRIARARVPGLPTGFRYHDLRHYLASLLIADGADVKTVQARLRHASAKTTLDTYGHLWPDRDESTRATIEAVFVTRRTEQGLNQLGAQ